MIAEQNLLELVNDFLMDYDVMLDVYQKINLYVYEEDVIKAIIKAGKFKDIGNVYDYPEVLPQPAEMSMYQLTGDFNLLERICISEKFNAVMNYTVDTYCVRCTILIDTDKLKKFTKIIRGVLNKDGGINIFRDVNFKCEKGEFIEIAKSSDEKERFVDVINNKISDENLVFDPESIINEVMNDINVFFKDSTVELYKKLEIPYKRGVILYGDPGNGKSAMIRELIRTIPDVSKIIINPGIPNVTYILASLVKALNGKKAIIVIEDMDSVINNQNRSEFLNILDGVNITSGVFFIGTTNYPERIDPAIMNRAGRFDRTYKIDNPSERVRRLFFESKKLDEIFDYYKVFKDDSKPDTLEGIIDLFVSHSDGLPMANLKELITSTAYLLAAKDDMSVEEAVTICYNTIINARMGHIDAYNTNASNQNNTGMRPIPSHYDDDDDDDDL